MNKQTSSNRLASRASQNELLTLPPINEAQIVTNSNMNGSKKNSRIDSGIDNGSHDAQGGGAVWTLSPHGSENNDQENSNYRHTAIVTTTVEIVENPSFLKKNGTSSTLNSYGKSSSIQSKLTTTTTNNSQQSSKKFNLSATSTSSNKANVNLNSTTNNEQEYIDSIARLHAVPDNNEYGENSDAHNQSRLKFEPSSKNKKNGKAVSNYGGSNNNLDISSHQNNDDYVYYSNISNGNGSNHSQNYYHNTSLPSGKQPFERSLTNYHLHQQKNTNLTNHFSVNTNNKKSNVSNTPRNHLNPNNTNKQQQQQQQQNLNISRQNTNLTEIKDFSPLMTRRNSNLTTNSLLNNSMQQNQNQSKNQPPIKPRKTDKRNTSLQRQNSFIAQVTESNYPNVNGNNNSKNQIQR